MTKRRRRNHPRHLPVRSTPREGGGIALEVGGVVQSVFVPETEDPAEAAGNVPPELVGSEPQPGPNGGYWGLLLPPRCPRRALLLGLGGGTVAHLLTRRCPNTRVTGIEHDALVLALARSQFGLETLPQLTIVESDAFAWVAAQHRVTKRDEGYDLICLDLFEAGRLAHGALATPFLRQVAELMSPSGLLTTNLMVTARTPDQLRRLERVFTLVWRKRLRGNLVVHGRLSEASKLPASDTAGAVDE
jgi:SAM-dependent methyltransferase